MINKALNDEFENILANYRKFVGYEENVLSAGSTFIVEQKELNIEHEFLNEIKNYINEGHTLNPIYVHDLRESLKIIEKRGTLSAESLYSFINFFASIEQLRSCFKDRSDLIRVNDLALDLKEFKRIEMNITRSILPDYSIADEASYELGAIRNKIKKEKSEIERMASSLYNTYKDYLTGDGMGVKNGLPVLPVKNTYRSRVKGVVEEVSNSGETYFVVPVEILDINNKIYVLKEREKAEEEKVLKALTDNLRENYREIVKDYEIAKRLDSLIGAVNYGNTYKGNIASINEEKLLLEDLFHPLLDVPVIVSNTVRLNKFDGKIMVVTGPNAGGKTVLLKSVALAVLMNQHGLLVATKGDAVLPLFDNVIYVGGDNQSLSENLSTFSGHLFNLNEGLKEATNNSVLLFDELGQGTAPLDGEALALSILDYIENLNSFAIVTSHFDKIKDRAIDDKKIIPAAMIFDEEKIEPTFKLRSGVVGKSYALDVAKRLGFIDSIVFKAKEYLNSFNDTPEKKLIEELTISLNKAKETEEKVQAKEKELERLIAKRSAAIESLNAEKQSLREKVEKNIEKIVDERIKALDEIWTPGSKVKSLPEMSKIKGSLNKIASTPTNKNEPIKVFEFEVGDYVKVKKANSNGRILAKNGNSYKVSCSGLSITCKASDLEKLADPKDQVQLKDKRKTASIDKYMATPKTGVGLECNLIGLRVDEALEKLGKYLDDCLLMKYHQVRIIHGVGTGALREAVRKYLDKKAFVDSYRFGGEGEGGVGSTVVTLK